MTLKLPSFVLIGIFVYWGLIQSAWAQDLRIGATLTLSGAYASYGRHALNGMQLAVDEANAGGGVGGRKVVLLVEDTGTYDLKRAVSSAKKLIDIDKVELFLPLIIEDSEVVVPLTAKVPMFSMVTGCGARKCGFNLGRFNVRAPSSHDRIVETLVHFALAQHVRHPCIIAAEATYFEGYGRYIEFLLRQAGLAPTYESVPLSASDDYQSIATRFKGEKCDAIFSWISMGSSGGFFRRVREVGSTALILGIVESDDPSVLSAAGQAAEGVTFARFSMGDPQFQEKYEKRFGAPPQRPAVPAYDGVKLLLQLVGEVGTNPEALRAAFLKIQDHPATNGTLSYTEEGERIGEAVELMRIANGISVPVP